MKSFFFSYLIPVLVGGGLTCVVLYVFWQSIMHFVDSWRQGRELNALEKDAGERRAERQRKARERLGNGCDHQWSAEYDGFPPKVCIKCGLERNEPPGECDHVWRSVPGPIAASKCEKCGQTYGGLADKDGRIYAE